MSGWTEILAFAEPDNAALAAACADPARQQTELLLTLLHDNACTAFGIEHGFEAIRSVDEFRSGVPVRSYAEIERWIARVADGEGNVLTRDDVVAFEETSGTSSGSKLIPYTARSLSAFRAAILPWLAALARRRVGVTHGRAYVAASPVTRVARRLPCGLEVGLPSEAAYLGRELEPALGAILLMPGGVEGRPARHTPTVQEPPRTGPVHAIDVWREATLAALTSCRDLSFISVWSPTFLLELADGLDTQRLWPQLDTISMWTDGASALYARRVAERFPHAHIDSKGLLATESAVTLRIDAAAGCIPALTSAVIEFADERGTCRFADELEPGATYRVIVTTPGGLYRYDTGDEVRCIGIASHLPRLEFIGRAGLVSDLVGEKVTEGFVSSALTELTRPTALVPQGAPHPHYEIWIDAPDSGDGAAIARSIDARLRHNPQYAYARDLGQLRAPITIFQPGFLQHRRDVLVTRGTRLGDVKLATLILDRSTLPIVERKAPTR